MTIRNILWSNESKIIFFGSASTAFNPEYTLQTVKHGRYLGLFLVLWDVVESACYAMLSKRCAQFLDSMQNSCFLVQPLLKIRETVIFFLQKQDNTIYKIFKINYFENSCKFH